MTEERYKELAAMDDDELTEAIQSDEEYDDFLKRKYEELTDHDAAVEELLGDISTAQQGALPVWPTGFSALDEKLDGGFLGGMLILLGAISSLGKTTFALQVVESIALAGNDVLVFSLEMSKKELLAKSISRNTYRLVEAEKTEKPRLHYTDASYRLTMGDVLRGRVGLLGEPKRELFDRALAETNKLKAHLRIIRNNNMTLGKIEELVRVHELVTGRKPFVLLDYLQILKHDGDVRGDKRLLTDDDVNRLKDLAVRYNVPIMVISSFNRNNYFEPASMGSFKESGTIEYSSDILIALQYSGMQYKKHPFTDEKGKTKKVYESTQEHNNRVRELLEKMDSDGAQGASLPVDLVILKNRGITKGKVLFEFCPRYNVFTEKPDQSEKALRAYEWDDDISGSPSVVSSEDDLGGV